MFETLLGMDFSTTSTIGDRARGLDGSGSDVPMAAITICIASAASLITLLPFHSSSSSPISPISSTTISSGSISQTLSSIIRSSSSSSPFTSSSVLLSFRISSTSSSLAAASALARAIASARSPSSSSSYPCWIGESISSVGDGALFSLIQCSLRGLTSSLNKSSSSPSSYLRRHHPVDSSKDSTTASNKPKSPKCFTTLIPKQTSPWS
mmetsp:Transcript_3571/g.4777  ORF Transcript_3571/g.4777 Transcript_3571/m.4777 type:complete len:209 (-) Transcript_3571:409-1035(-)